MRIVFLGTGGSWPSKHANTSSFAVQIPHRVLLFDCGEGTQRQIMHTNVSFMKISHIFITHFHGDHFLGLPGMIQSMALNRRKEKLTVVGPPGTGDLMKVILSLGFYTLTFPVDVSELRPGEEMKLPDGYIIKTFETDHTAPGIGYVLEEPPRPGKFNRKKAIEMGVPPGPLFSKLQRGEAVVVGGKKVRTEDVVGPPRRGRKLVYTGDTRPLRPVPEAWKNCDVLIHDSTLSHSMEKRALEYGHSTSVHAALAAKECNARVLFLFHRSPRYETPEPLVEEAKQVFPNTVGATDFLEYSVPLPD